MKYPPEKIEEAQKLKAFIEELCQQLPDDFVVIGGWAVHAYDTHNLTFDGDAMISTQANGILRDAYTVTNNARMRKQQFVGPTNHDIDLYVEYQHGLRIPYDELKTFAKTKGKMTVACPEHLIILKLDAARDRRNSSKGQKDLEDLAGLLSLPKEEFSNPDILERHMTAEDWKDLAAVAGNQSLAERLHDGNQWEAKTFREGLQTKITTLKRAAGIPPKAKAFKPPGEMEI